MDNGEISSGCTAEEEVTRFVGLLMGLSVDAINLGTAGDEGTLLQVVDHHLATLTKNPERPTTKPPNAATPAGISKLADRVTDRTATTDTPPAECQCRLFRRSGEATWSATDGRDGANSIMIVSCERSSCTEGLG